VENIGKVSDSQDPQRLYLGRAPIAAEPVPDPNDPRLKDWSPATRLFKDEPKKIVV